MSETSLESIEENQEFIEESIKETIKKNDPKSKPKRVMSEGQKESLMSQPPV